MHIWYSCELWHLKSSGSLYWLGARDIRLLIIQPSIKKKRLKRGMFTLFWQKNTLLDFLFLLKFFVFLLFCCFGLLLLFFYVCKGESISQNSHQSQGCCHTHKKVVVGMGLTAHCVPFRGLIFFQNPAVLKKKILFWLMVLTCVILFSIFLFFGVHIVAP